MGLQCSSEANDNLLTLLNTINGFQIIKPNLKGAGLRVRTFTMRKVISVRYNFIVRLINYDIITGENAVSNAALLQVVGDLDIKVKVEVPQVEKEVKEDSTGNFGEAADYAIGDTVPFQFLSAVPNMDEFEKYVYILSWTS